MQALNIHSKIVSDYKDYLKSFNIIRDDRIRRVVDDAFKDDQYIPEPLIQFNPSFKRAADFKELEKEGVLHPYLERIFGDFKLFKHQEEAIRLGAQHKSFVVTSGTGSGKSLTFLGTIFNYIFKHNPGPGIKAVLVYPMNALINSQEEEIQKFADNFGDGFPISFSKYTGQENEEKRLEIEKNPPDILLTNYMMLELLLTRAREKYMRDSFALNLRFLIFDELHTYRGRQGADIAMLIRRLRAICNHQIKCIGTSATMVSGNDMANSKQLVADFASLIFAESIQPNQIIDETLETTTNFDGKLPGSFDLQEAIHQPIDKNSDQASFRNHPVAIWLENKIALTRQHNGFIRRGKPLPLKEIIELLSIDAAEADLEKCKLALINLFEWSEMLNIKYLAQKISFLPFKIHQFISQTGNVYVTLENRTNRKITLTDGMYIKEESGEEKTLFPVLFSRYSGFDFICVKKNFSEQKLIPREITELPEKITKDDLKGNKELGTKKRTLTEQDFEAGYLLLPEPGEELWSDDLITTLPDTWWKTKHGEVIVDNFYTFRLPQKIYFNSQGSFSTEQLDGFNQIAWFIAAPLYFDPTAGIVFDSRTNENTKLMRVGNVGKSTATTIATFSILKSQHQQNVPKEIQKVLSFTDNRQDASLQAGHFNDFLMIGRLRSAIYHALKSTENNQLKIEHIADAVYNKLGIQEIDYARNPGDPDWPDLENVKAIKDFLTVRILYDLRRGWRFNTPNLEQCALLKIDYERLTELSQTEKFFENDQLLSRLSPEERYTFLLHFLNYFRTAFAFDYYKLDSGNIRSLEERLKQRLHNDKEWSLSEDEHLEIPALLVYRSPGKTDKSIFTQSIGPNSNLAKYIKRVFNRHGMEPIKGESLADYIGDLCAFLKGKHFLSVRNIKGDKGSVLAYSLRVENIIWRLGDGQEVLTDEVRIITNNDKLIIKPNSYFKRFYQQDFLSFKKFFRASEHTGQIQTEDRIKREIQFREGEISALYCSPTMELGIDIASLNIVHMRNVPPSPSNYTQRSGRAGRSGQTAVVFTYCSYSSPHDRHYFRNSIQMVAGVVNAPRIDMVNEELLNAHLNAFILMQLGLSGVKSSVEDVINISDKKVLPVKNEIEAYIKEQILLFGKQWLTDFKKIIEHDFSKFNNTFWFNEEWLQKRIKEFYNKFDQAFERWRSLFRAASGLIERATMVINDPTVASSSSEAWEAKRMLSIGGRQRDLLLNVTNRSSGSNESEFYIYRYMAAEGFLPGYNFTRLPVRAFIGKKNQDKGIYISRPRFIALREFGPGNLIYHDGSKFRVTRLQFTEADLKTHSLKVSKKTGYAWLNDQSVGINNDPLTGEPLKGQDAMGVYNKKLIQMVETDTWPVERISSEEEDRLSAGYEMEQYFNYPRGIESTKRTTLSTSGHPLLNLTFCQATQLIQLNKKWKRSKDQEEGFIIGKTSGKYLRKVDLELDERKKDPGLTIHLYNTDTADTLYLQPIKALELDEAGVISLTYALKRAIERVFQIEESEINVWFMGPEDARNIMIYEAAEGSLGILSQLIEDTVKLREVFTEAYKVIHYDPVTKSDAEPDWPKASYDDLLSYYNQRFHDKLDRHSIKGALELLMICESDNTAAISSEFSSREEQMQYLMENYDEQSVMEKKLIEYLYKYMLRLPDKSQVNLSGIVGFYISADFIYMKKDQIEAIVFCDGSVHDKHLVKDDDTHKRKLLRDAGFDVIIWHYSESLESLTNRRKDIFRKI